MSRFDEEDFPASEVSNGETSAWIILALSIFTLAMWKLWELVWWAVVQFAHLGNAI